MAATSFMVGPSCARTRDKFGRALIGAPRASLASFRSNGTKSCRRERKTAAAARFAREPPCTGPGIVRQDAFHRQRSCRRASSLRRLKGGDMSNRSWFFASEGKQQGPYPEARLRELIASGTVTADTLVWSEGMTGWQK